MAKSKRHAVTVLLTEDHLPKMIDDPLIREEDIGDRVKVARWFQNFWNGAWTCRTGRGTIGMTG